MKNMMDKALLDKYDRLKDCSDGFLLLIPGERAKRGKGILPEDGNPALCYQVGGA